jgi:thymidylate synthase (FAD)
MRTLTPIQSLEIAEARANPTPTLRLTSPGAEAVMHEMLPVLDHGFVRLVDYMGDDRSIPRAARMSYGKGTKTLSDDTALIRYLLRHRHTTPFEMASVQVHVAAPIFVARQWFRHRTSTFNEYSARYSILEREFYVPEPEHLAAQSTTNKQGRGAVLEGADAAKVLDILKRDAAQAYDDYEWMINDNGDGTPVDDERAGLTRELARINLPVSIYTQFYWNINLWNLMHFLKLRADAHAQYEIRVYAEEIFAKILKPWVPAASDAFDEFIMHSNTLSRSGSGLLNAAILAAKDGRLIDPAEFGVKGRELAEAINAFPALADMIRR